MVRIKHRYLLIEILYPTSTTPQSKSQTQSSTSPTTPAQSLLAAPPPTLTLHAPTPDSITTGTLIRLIRTQITSLFGDYGAGLSNNGLSIKYFSNATSTFILRCERAAFRLVWAAVTFVRGLGSAAGGAGARDGYERKGRGGGGGGASGAAKELSCVMQVLRVSGTIRKCEEELIKRAKALCGRVKGLTLAAEAGVGADGVVVSEDDDGREGDEDEDVAMVEKSEEDDGLG